MRDTPFGYFLQGAGHDNLEGSTFCGGGGQILRTSLSLAAVTGKPVQLENIRANREKPGLMRQHLACAKSVAEICRGELEGAELNSRALTLKPGRIHGGDYRFVIGSAGNTLLLAQAVLPVLLFADRPSRVVLEGGTYTTQAPVFDFFERAISLPAQNGLGGGGHHGTRRFLSCRRRQSHIVRKARPGLEAAFAR